MICIKARIPAVQENIGSLPRQELRMRVEKHDLAHEFPEYRDQIHRLKMTGQHFSNWFNEYQNKDELYAILCASHSV
jgi:hypothetical protein